MKVLVTGVNGQLGNDVTKELLKRGHDVVGVDIGEMDITDGRSVEKVMDETKPDAVVHCAAYTNVDAAEEAENRETVRLVNTVGTENIAKQCKKLDCKLIYISTDYVFDGMGEEPWKADCKNFRPLNVYGKTKLDGERAVEKYTDKFFIVRIAWAFGAKGHNFVKTMLKVSDATVRVVNDQIGTPTYTLDLARLLADMAESDKYGYYHATNEGGYISWCDFAKAIFETAGYDTKVESVTTAQYGLSKAARPFNSRLDKSKLVECGFKPLPSWRDALERYLKEIGY